MKPLLKFLTALALLAAPLFAEPRELTNRTADELCGALQKLSVGLSGVNAVKATRNLIALRPLAEAYAAGLKAELANRKITATTRTDSAEFAAYVAAVETFADVKVKVDLQPIKMTDEELERVGGGTAPAVLEVIIRYLEPKK